MKATHVALLIDDEGGRYEEGDMLLSGTLRQCEKAAREEVTRNKKYYPYSDSFVVRVYELVDVGYERAFTGKARSRDYRRWLQ